MSIAVGCDVWICISACPDGCSFCTYDSDAKKSKCVLGQCNAGHVMKSDGTCKGMIWGVIRDDNINEYRHVPPHMV